MTTTVAYGQKIRDAKARLDGHDLDVAVDRPAKRICLTVFARGDAELVRIWLAAEHLSVFQGPVESVRIRPGSWRWFGLGDRDTVELRCAVKSPAHTNILWVLEDAETVMLFLREALRGD